MVGQKHYIAKTQLLAALLISMQLIKVALRIALKGAPGDGLALPSWSRHHPGTTTSAAKARSTSAPTLTTRISTTTTNTFAASTTTTNTFSASTTTTNTFASFYLSLKKSLYVYIAMYYFLPCSCLVSILKYL
ncbi:hypothetical protein AMTRI_Chr10g4530 [Amborella trichopoda]